MCLHDTIKHGFHYAARNPIVMISAATLLNFFESNRCQFGRIQEVCDIEAYRQLSLPPQLVIEVEPFEILASAVHTHQPKLVRFMHSQAKRRQSLFAAGLWHEFGHQFAG